LQKKRFEARKIVISWDFHGGISPQIWDFTSKTHGFSCDLVGLNRIQFIHD
jgi:hypothetical protein